MLIIVTATALVLCVLATLAWATRNTEGARRYGPIWRHWWSSEVDDIDRR